MNFPTKIGVIFIGLITTVALGWLIVGAETGSTTQPSGSNTSTTSPEQFTTTTAIEDSSKSIDTQSTSSETTNNQTSAIETTTGAESTKLSDSTSGDLHIGVKLVDIIAPIIKLIGESKIYIKEGSSFINPGAKAIDNIDGDISSRIVQESNVNPKIPGSYKVIYKVEDNAGNKAYVERIVIVTQNSSLTTESTVNYEVDPNTEFVAEPVQKTPESTSSTPPPVKTDSILRSIRAESIMRAEAEQRNKLLIEQLGTMKRPTSTPEMIVKIAELKLRRPTSTPEIIEEKTKRIIEHFETPALRERRDSDKDGITDYDEDHIYKTNPLEFDTDGDGYSDGSEILSGYDPLNPELQGRIAYENPKDSGVIKEKFFTVQTITLMQEKETANKILFKGKSLPSSFITLYIFSTPLVIMVKTDRDGNWEYILDKELEDGSHELQIAMTDDTGRILVKNNAIPFVKTAEAITVDQSFLTPISVGKVPSLVWNSYMYALLLLIISIIGIAFVVIGTRKSSISSSESDSGDKY